MLAERGSCTADATAATALSLERPDRRAASATLAAGAASPTPVASDKACACHEVDVGEDDNCASAALNSGREAAETAQRAPRPPLPLPGAGVLELITGRFVCPILFTGVSATGASEQAVVHNGLWRLDWHCHPHTAHHECAATSRQARLRSLWSRTLPAQNRLRRALFWVLYSSRRRRSGSRTIDDCGHRPRHWGQR